MSKTYNSWAEIEDWSRGRAFRRPSKRKQEIEWRKTSLEEIEEWEQDEDE